MASQGPYNTLKGNELLGLGIERMQYMIGPVENLACRPDGSRNTAGLLGIWINRCHASALPKTGIVKD